MTEGKEEKITSYMDGTGKEGLYRKKSHNYQIS